MGPHFDESLAALTAHRAAIAGALLASAASAAVVLTLLVRRARPRWRCDLGPMRSAGPYRGAVVARAEERDIPPLVRAAAASCFAYGHFFLPLIVVTLATLRFDGIAVPLIPGVAVALTTWISGWLLIARAESAPEIVRASAVASLVLNVSMLVLSVAHLAYVELASQVHECSSSFAFIALVVSVASVPQSMLVLTAVSRHAAAYGRDPALASAVPSIQSAARTARYRALTSEILEAHIRFHVLDPGAKTNSKRARAAEELIDVVRAYMK